MSVWSSLTDVQADAVHASAALLLRDPEELAAELAPLLSAASAEDPPTVNDFLTAYPTGALTP